MPDKTYCCYIMASKRNGTLYVGITSDLKKRCWQHRNGTTEGFTCRYNVTRLVYFEVFRDSIGAITREKQLKAGSRQRKIELIEAENPKWLDLYPTL